MSGKLVVAAVAATLVLASCSTQVGVGLPTVDSLDGLEDDDATPLAGTLRIDGGCFLVEIDSMASIAIWPAGFAAETDRLTGPDELVLRDGDQLTGDALILSEEDLAPHMDGPDGYIATFLNQCNPEQRPVTLVYHVDAT